MQQGGVQNGPGESKLRIEDYYAPSDNHLSYVGRIYDYFYRFRNQRSGNIRQLQYNSFDEYLRISRELFWNSSVTQSEDLRKLGLDFSLPFIRKEVMEFQGRLTALNLKVKIAGELLGIYGAAVLHSIYKKWRLHNNDDVEKFCQVLYGQVNGTVCVEYGFDMSETERKYLRGYNPQTNAYSIEKKKVKMWNDVTATIVPIEEMYLAKLWERNIQKQGKTIRMREMSWAEFQVEYSMYPESKYVLPGGRIAEDSLYFRLLGGTGVTTADKVQILTLIDTDNGEKMVVSNGIWLDYMGDRDNPVPMPLPFLHGMQPYSWVLNEMIDEKFAYGLSLPFKEKDPHKILNTMITMAVESELRAIDPPFLTSDFEAPKLIFGAKKVIPVNDVKAYQQVDVKEASQSFFTVMNTIQGIMSDQSQGGNSDIVPSRQPKSAREVMAVQQQQENAMANAKLMYQNLIYQEFHLVVKTALQFYQVGKYEQSNLIRSLLVPNSPLSKGGVGNMEVRIVKEKKDRLALMYEGIVKSFENGKETEIIEVPVDALNNLDFYIEDILLEPATTPDIERANFFERILQPAIQVFGPAGLVDMGKLYLRWLEKMGEHPSDYSSDQVLSKLMTSWGQPSPFKFFQVNAKGQVMSPTLAAPGGNQQQENAMQTTTGMAAGGMSGGGQNTGQYPQM